MAEMIKPKNLSTAHYIYGINVNGKEVIEVPEHLVGEFKKLGFKEVKNGGKVDTADRNKKRSSSQAVRNTRKSKNPDELIGQDIDF